MNITRSSRINMFTAYHKHHRRSFVQSVSPAGS